MRVGDVERNSAITALGEHMTAGRLDIDEYGKRSAQANAARTVADLRSLFTDLPAPHPVLPGVRPAPLPRSPGVGLAPATGSAVAPVGQPEMSKAQKVAAGLAAAGSGIAVVLFFLLSAAHVSQAWLVFLVIPILYSVGAAVWGPEWRGPRRR